jgi:hypothetical protein
MGSIGAAIGPLLTGIIAEAGGFDGVFLMLYMAAIAAGLLLIRLCIKEVGRLAGSVGLGLGVGVEGATAGWRVDCSGGERKRADLPLSINHRRVSLPPAANAQDGRPAEGALASALWRPASDHQSLNQVDEMMTRRRGLLGTPLSFFECVSLGDQPVDALCVFLARRRSRYLGI